MKSYFKLGVLFSVMALAVSAFAGSITAVEESALVGNVPNTSVHSSSASLSFAGSFSGLSGAKSQSSSNNGISGQLQSGSNTVPVLTSRDWRKNQQVPDGGTEISYLAASGLVLFAGIFLAGKQRRRPAEN